MAMRSPTKILPTKPILTFDTSFKSFLQRENEFPNENYVKPLPKVLKIEIYVKLTADLAKFRKNHGTQAFSSAYLAWFQYDQHNWSNFRPARASQIGFASGKSSTFCSFYNL